MLRKTKTKKETTRKNKNNQQFRRFPDQPQIDQTNAKTHVKCARRDLVKNSVLLSLELQGSSKAPDYLYSLTRMHSYHINSQKPSSLIKAQLLTVSTMNCFFSMSKTVHHSIPTQTVVVFPTATVPLNFSQIKFLLQSTMLGEHRILGPFTNALSHPF